MLCKFIGMSLSFIGNNFGFIRIILTSPANRLFLVNEITTITTIPTKVHFIQKYNKVLWYIFYIVFYNIPLLSYIATAV